MTMTPRERLLATARFEPLDRPFRNESIGFWDETLVRWHGEGLSSEVNNLMTAVMQMGYDLQVPIFLGVHEHPGFDPLFEEEIIERGERHTIKRDISGSVVKVFTDGSSMLPALIEPPVRDRESWERVKFRLDPETPGRLALCDTMAAFAGDNPVPLIAFLPGLFGTHRHLLGFEPLMVAYRKQPELLHEIARHWVALWKHVIGHLHARRPPEMVFLWEDMCYKNGPMISPRAFDAFMTPYYRELVGFFRNDLRVPIVHVDTDGNLTELIPKFIEAGVNSFWPFEVQAGMDILKVREEWPRQFMIWGGIDKRALAAGREAIREEVMRVVPPMVRQGGYIPGIDHMVPPDVPYDDWVYFLDLVREVGEKECAKSKTG